MVRMLVMVFLGSDCSVLCFAAYKQLQTFIFLLKDPGWTGWDWQGLAPGCRLGPNLFGLAAAWGLPFSWQIMQVSRAYQPVQAWKIHVMLANMLLAKAKHIVEPSVSAVGARSLLYKALWWSEERRNRNSCPICHVFHS